MKHATLKRFAKKKNYTRNLRGGSESKSPGGPKKTLKSAKNASKKGKRNSKESRDTRRYYEKLERSIKSNELKIQQTVRRINNKESTLARKLSRVNSPKEDPSILELQNNIRILEAQLHGLREEQHKLRAQLPNSDDDYVFVDAEGRKKRRKRSRKSTRGRKGTKRGKRKSR